MTATVIDGRAASTTIRSSLRDSARRFASERDAPPTIAVVFVGSDPPSERYARQIKREFERNDFGVVQHRLGEDTPESEVTGLLADLGANPAIHGVLVEMPLPPHVSVERVSLAIPVAKDVDGVHPINAGFLFSNSGSFFAPATPSGGIALLEHIGASVRGKRAVVIGRSASVGKPMAFMLLHRDATVTICHSHTADLESIVGQADILVAAAGVPRLVQGEWLRPGAIVIDFGASVVGDSVVGDVEYESALEVAGAITPVPGGTGPMTVTMLMKNTLMAAQRTFPSLTR
ncbi:MAG: bifunctional 5,10-methylenetetrahydrofolate dehydrogenase/5,10-methenyltetrahydrofolate cyclohydrolase [Chloroflexota bacterium]|nr:MAG: bifunctional 5,10-methylenetetrahydrofolate dehydrogenase/5,10-methenyltetrahydrofolate cyclohydrolase [Chloroflexota bacterium]